MNLAKKRQIAARSLRVGKNRVIFNMGGLSEIKEAITKQDIKDLHSEGIIGIRPLKGRKKIEKRKNRRGPGKIKKKVNKRKQIYVKITRKLRGYLKELKDQEKIELELYKDLRKKIRMRAFRSKKHLKEQLKNRDIDLNKPLKKINKKTKGDNKK